ncbi:MAG: ABC transporter permease [Clostridia bacterium]|nr:ABC transporter permease [Clostridia bacterium]
MKYSGDKPKVFLKLLKFEAKRYFANITLPIIACIVPILLITTILGSLLPVLFRGAELNNIKIALFNEDPTYETNMIIRHLAESDSVEDFVEIVEADSLEDAKAMLITGEAAAALHIPQGLQEGLYHGESQTIYYYAGDTEKQLALLIYDMIKSGLKNINQAQKSADIVYYAMQDMGYSWEQASGEYSSMAEKLFVNIISRSQIYSGYSEVTATGDYLNIEYYLISAMLLCLFFLALPIAAKMSTDRVSGVMDRGGFYLNSFGYVLSKVIAGSAFLLLPAAVTSIFILAISGAFSLFSGEVWQIILSVVLSVLYFASVMLFIGSFSRSATASIWIGFSAALIISMASGIFIPRNLMPRGIAYISEFTGLPGIIKMFGSSLFGVKSEGIALEAIKVSAVSAAAFLASYIKTRRRMSL